MSDGAPSQLEERLAALRKKDKALRVGSITELQEYTGQSFPTGNVAMDLALGVNGFPQGKVIELYGISMSGKTTMALQTIACHQARLRTGEAAGAVLYLDYEHSLDQGYCQDLGIDTEDADTFIYVQPETFEQGAQLFRDLAAARLLAFAVFDSVAAMVPRSELEAESGAYTFGDRARAQPLDAGVLTPYGWTTMAKIAVGDEVSTPSGDIARVLSLSEQVVRPVYRVRCSDGTETEASGDHLWTVRRTSCAPWQLLTTAEVAALIQSGKRWNRAYLPKVQADFPAQEHVIPPYVLGALLANGHLGAEHSPVITMYEDDASETFERILDQVPWLDLREVPDAGRCRSARLVDAEWRRRCTHCSDCDRPARARGLCLPHYQARAKAGTLPETGWDANRSSRFNDELARLGLRGLRAWEKHMPEDYWIDSRANRIELLRGLMDSDGTVTDSGNGSYSTTSQMLAMQVRDLVLALGGESSIRCQPVGPKHSRPSYKVRVSTEFNPFRNARKASRWKPRQVGRPRRIIAIEYLREDIVQCIRLDHPDQLYLTDALIPTHNSLHQFFRQAKGLMARTGTSVIMLNHVMDKIDTSPMGRRLAAQGVKRSTTPGGTSIEFYADVRVVFTRIGDLKTREINPVSLEEEKLVTATDVKALVLKNKVATPQKLAWMRVRYGKGFSEPYSVLMALLGHGRVTKTESGGWYTFPAELSPTGEKWRSQEEPVLTRLETDTAWFRKMEDLARTLVSDDNPQEQQA